MMLSASIDAHTLPTSIPLLLYPIRTYMYRHMCM